MNRVLSGSSIGDCTRFRIGESPMPDAKQVADYARGPVNNNLQATD